MLQMLFRLYPIICLARNSGGADCPCPVLLCFFINHEHYLQSYQENDNCLYRMIQTAESNAVKPVGAELFGAFSREELEQMAELVRKYVGKVVLRGVVGT